MEIFEAHFAFNAEREEAARKCIDADMSWRGLEDEIEVADNWVTKGVNHILAGIMGILEIFLQVKKYTKSLIPE